MAVIVARVAGGHLLADRRSVRPCDLFAELTLHKMEKGGVIPSEISMSIVDISIIESARTDQIFILLRYLLSVVARIAYDGAGRIDRTHGLHHVAQNSPFFSQQPRLFPVHKRELH